MKKIVFYLFLISTFLFVSSCDDEQAPQETRLELSHSELDFEAAANARAVAVKTNLSEVLIESSESWCQGVLESDEIVVTVTDNNQRESRSAKLTIEGGGIQEFLTIRQLGHDKEILVTPSSLSIPTLGGNYEIQVTSNTEFEFELPTWVRCLPITKSSEMVTTAYTLAVDPNALPDKREGRVVIRAQEEDVFAEIVLLQKGMDDYDNTPGDDILDDIKLSIVGASASSHQKGQEIEKSFDGDLSTNYHSSWNNSPTNYFPITLTYRLEQVDLDYIVYYPRKSGVNGNFELVEISITTSDDPSPKLLKEMDFKGSGSPTRISFDETLQNVTSVIFKVLSGAGDDEGFASCAEMEFYQKNPDNYDYLTLFADHSCSTLKEGVTVDDINACPNAFFKNIATLLFHQSYPDDFRIATYKAWLRPNIQSSELKTSPYSLRDNPTGISVKEGEELVVCVDDTYGENISIFIQNLDTPGEDGFNNGTSYTLATGVNRFLTNTKGLVYVMYHSDEPEAKQPVKIHFATGTVNGYYDTQKHDPSQWEELLANASDKYFDVLGKYAHLVFPTEQFRTHTNNLHDLISLYDELVYEEAVFMGLEKYDRMFRNRHYFQVMYKSYMYATSYRTCYNVSTMPALCNEEKLSTSPWGPAHEVGHCNQTRPGMKWPGMTEVTNNIHSLYIQTLWGNESRLMKESRYDQAHSHVGKFPQGAFANFPNVFTQLVPFWQLYLYIAKAQNKADFYKDLYELVRVSPNPATGGACQIEFVKKCISISKLDLSDFFEYWGFMTPVDKELDDYGKKRFTVTQAQVDALRSWIDDQNYPKPAHEFWKITDDNRNDFQ